MAKAQKMLEVQKFCKIYQNIYAIQCTNKIYVYN